MKCPKQFQLSFFEAFILMENILRVSSQAEFIVSLDGLISNTEDVILLDSLRLLLCKIQNMTPQEFIKLQRDTAERKILFPPNYLIPPELNS